MSAKTVLLMDAIAELGVELLGESATVVKAPESSADTIRRLAKDADGIIIRSKLPDDIFEAAPRLKAVCIHGTGTDLVPLASATAHGVMVANVPGANAQSVAEYCVMGMLMLARNVVAITADMRSRPWDEARMGAMKAAELQHTTVGVVGMGEIGQRVAKICRRGFDMRVLGTQRRLDRMGPDAEPAALETLLRQSDYVIIACPLTQDTRHLINARTLGLMKPTAWLVNVGRGAVIREEDLIQALQARRIAGAMLDVYESYQIRQGHPLFALDNVILTPHLAGGTHASRARASVAAAKEMLRMLAGEPPLNFVNPEVRAKAHAS
ncbi:MAG TPA: NAD(P)-dependent oxidoreductase [Burkholderiales bacterium]|nr:NAD(P)-dependent oxidoreductase [Burkholderiales bacterium]